MTRSFMIDQLSQEYIVAARIKGCSFWRVVWGHAFPNILVALITVIILSYRFVAGGRGADGDRVRHGRALASTSLRLVVQCGHERGARRDLGSSAPCSLASMRRATSSIGSRILGCARRERRAAPVSFPRSLRAGLADLEALSGSQTQATARRVVARRSATALKSARRDRPRDRSRARSGPRCWRRCSWGAPSPIAQELTQRLQARRAPRIGAASRTSSGATSTSPSDLRIAGDTADRRARRRGGGRQAPAVGTTRAISAALRRHGSDACVTDIFLAFPRLVLALAFAAARSGRASSTR